MSNELNFIAVEDTLSSTSVAGEARVNISVFDDIADIVTVNVDTGFGESFGRKQDGIRLGFGREDSLGELGALVKGVNLDFRGNSNGDDLYRILNEAFNGDGIDNVTATIESLDTVKLVTNFGGAQDTITITGDYVAGFLSDSFGDNFIIDGGRAGTDGDIDLFDGQAETVIVNVDRVTGSFSPLQLAFLGNDSQLGDFSTDGLNRGTNLDLRGGGYRW